MKRIFEMNNPNQPMSPGHFHSQRRRRRRHEFLEALQKSQADSSIPIVDVGLRLREIRMGGGLTIRDLARKSGLNVNTLSMIENGKASPSVETLQQLSLTLGIPITAFFEDNTPKKQIVHYKAGQRLGIAFAYGILEDLGAEMPQRGAETFLVTLDPGSKSGEDPIVHTGRETVYCLEGQLTYSIDGQAFVLEPGDSLCFEAHLPHRWQNTGAIPARSLLVLCPSDELDRPTERHFLPELARSEIVLGGE
jgi:transcriptional regulator with XRE-family HTH domain